MIIYATDETEQHAREIAEEFEQIQRMNVLIKGMLDGAKLQGEVFELSSQENVNIIELVRRMIERISPVENSISIQNNEESSSDHP